MQQFKKQFTGVVIGEIYPRSFEAGEFCPPELEAGALSLGAIDALSDADSTPDRSREALDAALASLPGNQTDADYVVRAMRSYFGDVFSADDEAKVHEAVKPVARKPSDGLKVEDLKAALAEKGIAIPDGITLKADLAALLDGKA